jgi:hypothetical protein
VGGEAMPIIYAIMGPYDEVWKLPKKGRKINLSQKYTSTQSNSKN